MWVRWEVAAETSVSGPDKHNRKDPVGNLVRNHPRAKDPELSGVAAGHVQGLERVELERNNGALANWLRDVSVCAGLGEARRNRRRAGSNSAKHCYLSKQGNKLNEVVVQCVAMDTWWRIRRVRLVRHNTQRKIIIDRFAYFQATMQTFSPVQLRLTYSCSAAYEYPQRFR